MNQPEAALGAPSSAGQEEYLKTVTAAVAEFDDGRFAEARALFLRAHELLPSARTWRTLGMTAFELRMYPRALIELQAALDDPHRPLPAEQRAQIAALLEQTHAFVGRYRLRLSPAEATISVDGAPITLAPDATLLLAVGQHELWLRAPGFQDARISLQVQGREDEERTLALEPIRAPLPAPSPPDAPAARSVVKDVVEEEQAARLRTAAWVAVGVSAAGFVTGMTMGGLAIAKKSELDDLCPQKMCAPSYDDERARFERFAHASTAGIVVGATALAAATYLWLRQRRSVPARDRGLVLLTPFGLAGRF